MPLCASPVVVSGRVLGGASHKASIKEESGPKGFVFENVYSGNNVMISGACPLLAGSKSVLRDNIASNTL